MTIIGGPGGGPGGGGHGGGGGQHGEPTQDDLGQQPTSVAQELMFLQAFMTLEEPERQIIGHNFSSFIRGCTFRGRDCLNES